VILRALLEGPENGPELAVWDVVHNGRMSQTTAAIEASAQARRDRVAARVATGVKHCPKCCAPGQTLPLSAFYVIPSMPGRDGHSAYCRSCTRQVVTHRYRKAHGMLPELADLSAATDGLVVKKRYSRGHSGGVIPDLPRVPDWGRGLCVTLPIQQRAWWTSARHADQEAAVLACQSCPILDACRSWALSVSEFYTNSVTYGGLTGPRLRELRREITRQVRG
jgi:hypothetical protein